MSQEMKTLISVNEELPGNRCGNQSCPLWSLDNAIITSILLKLNYRDVAACCVACKLLRDHAEDPAVWHSAVLQVEPEELRHKVILNSSKGNYKEYLRQRMQLWRALQDKELIATALDEDLTFYDARNGNTSTHKCFSATVPNEDDVDVHQPSWSPNGRYIAYSKLQESCGSAICWVVVADAAGDRILFQLHLPGPYLPFYLHWSSCGSYLALLSNWAGQRVALRVVDVASALCAQLRKPRICCAGAARPLFIAWSPLRPQLLVHHGTQHCAIWDAGTAPWKDCHPRDDPQQQQRSSSSSSATSHPNFFGAPESPPDAPPTWTHIHSIHAAALLSLQALQWVVTSSGQERLLLPHVDMSPVDPDAFQGLPNLGVVLKKELSLHLVPPGDVQLSAATQVAGDITDLMACMTMVNAGATLLAVASRAEVFVVPLRTSEQQQQQEEEQQQAVRVWPPAGWGKQPGIAALQWSPDGRRLLVLMDNWEMLPEAVHTPVGSRWMVFEWQGTAAASGSGHRLYLGAPVEILNDTFRASYLPFWDQYKLSHSLWAPDSGSFAYCGLGPQQEGARLRRMQQERLAVQELPSSCSAATQQQPQDPGSSSQAATAEAGSLDTMASYQALVVPALGGGDAVDEMCVEVVHMGPPKWTDVEAEVASWAVRRCPLRLA